MKTNKKLNEGIRLAKEGIEECWDDMGGQEMTTDGNGEQMSVTISMPGKNISVTTDSADEIGNILRLAGITLGGDAPMGDVDGDGDHDMTDHAAEVGATEPEVMYVGANSGEMSNSGEAEMSAGSGMGNSGQAEIEDEDEPKEATQTPKPWTDKEGKEHPGTAVKGDRYGNQDDKEEKEEEVKESGYVNEASGITISGKEVDIASLQVEGVDSNDYPDFSDAYIYQASFTDGTDLNEDELNELNDRHGDLVNELAYSSLHESARILELAGITNEAQSAAQKAAFAKMIAKKNGKDSASDDTDDMADDKGDNKKPDDDGDGIPNWADKDKEVKEEAPATNSIFGQGVYESEAAPHDYIDYVNAGGEEPSADLINQPGVEYDPESGIISVRNSTSLTDTHRSLEAAGWKKHALAARRNPAGAGQARQAGDTAYQLESARILALAGVAESKLMNSPAGTSMDEPKLFDNLPSGKGTGKGRADFGANRANGQGENPMGDGSHTVSVEEQFAQAMGEYRKFVSENLARKK